MDYKKIEQKALRVEGRAQIIGRLAKQIDYEGAADYMEREKQETEKEIRKLLQEVQELMTEAEFLPW